MFGSIFFSFLILKLNYILSILYGCVLILMQNALYECDFSNTAQSTAKKILYKVVT